MAAGTNATGSGTQMAMREVLAIVPLRKLTAAQLVSLFGDFLAIFAIFSIVSFRRLSDPWRASSRTAGT